MDVYLRPGDPFERDGMIYIHKGFRGQFSWDDVKDQAIPRSQWEEERRVANELADRRVQEQEEQEQLAFHRVLSLLTPELISALNDWHEAKGWSCNAASEGLLCCVEELLSP
jgi:hypothetical protein